MAHTIAGKKPLLARVRRIKGQVEGLERSLDAEDDCLRVLQQIAAIRGAMNGLMSQVLEGHLRDHLGPEVVDAKTRQKDLDGVIAALRSYLR